MSRKALTRQNHTIKWNIEDADEAQTIILMDRGRLVFDLIKAFELSPYKRSTRLDNNSGNTVFRIEVNLLVSKNPSWQNKTTCSTCITFLDCVEEAIYSLRSYVHRFFNCLEWSSLD